MLQQQINFNQQSQTPSRGVSGTQQLGTDMWKQLNCVSIPTFSGDKRTYESWRAAFYTCVDAAPATPEYKLLQLRSYLRGEALQAVERLGHSATAYEAAKERLERKYGGGRRKVAVSMEELDAFKPVRPGVAQDVERLADFIDVLCINLNEMGRHHELEDGSLYLKTQKKLTESMLTNYRRWMYEHNRRENMASIREWLNKESEFLVEASETICGTAHATPPIVNQPVIAMKDHGGLIGETRK